MAASCLGLSHPPSAPTWTLLAWAFLQCGNFPDPARGTNLFSGLCSAVTAGALFLLCRTWISRFQWPFSSTVASLAGAFAVFVYFGSPTVVEQSLVTEQYSLVTALLALLLLFATKFLASPASLTSSPEDAPSNSAGQSRLWLLFGIGWGVAIGNHLHQLSLAPWVLMMAWTAFSEAKERPRPGNNSARFFLFLIAGFLIGSSIYLYLPIRSASNPLIDWGNPESANGFFSALARKGWRYRSIFDTPPGFIADWAKSYDFIHNIGWGGLMTAAWGAWLLQKRKLPLGQWIPLIFLSYGFFIFYAHLRHEVLDLTYLRAYGVDFHPPLYMLISVLSGIGFAGVWLALAPLHRPLAILLTTGLLTVSAFGCLQTFNTGSLRNFTGSTRYLQGHLPFVPEDAIILTTSDNLVFELAYHRYVLHPEAKTWVSRQHNGWEDLHPISSSTFSWQERRRRYFLEVCQDQDFQILRVPPPTASQAEKSRIFIENRFNPETTKFLLPAGCLFELVGHPTTDEEVRSAEERWRLQAPGLFPAPEALNRLERDAWRSPSRARGMFFFQREMWKKAAECFLESLGYFEGDALVWYHFGITLEHLSKFKEAVSAYRQALTCNSGTIGPSFRLAALALMANRPDLARAYAEQELTKSPGHPDVLEFLQQIASESRLPTRMEEWPSEFGPANR